MLFIWGGGCKYLLSLLGWIYTQAKEVTVYDMMLRLCNERIAQSLVLE